MLVGWVGATLLLSRVAWFARARLVDRLRPYAPSSRPMERRAETLSTESIREVVGPLAQNVGATISKLFGITEELSTRLERIHSPMSVNAFRNRQLGWAIVAFALASMVALTTPMPVALILLLVIGAPLLSFLVIEQGLVHRCAHWQREVFTELPIVSEQLGMLLSAGYSTGAALNRIASRGNGACSKDIARVCGRLRQGLNESAALEEWARVVDVPAVDRLVAVLSLNREAGDLGRLMAEESRGMRRDAHRVLVESIERRGQQVWIPVTVATLVPGVLFLAVPFIEAMRLFTAA